MQITHKIIHETAKRKESKMKENIFYGQDMYIKALKDPKEVEAIKEYIEAHKYLNYSMELNREGIKDVATTLFKKKRVSHDEIKKVIIFLAHQEVEI